MTFNMMQPDGSETGQLIVANGYASTNPIATGHQSHLVYHKVVYQACYYFVYNYINDTDTNIISKMFKFTDDSQLCHRARNRDDIMELQQDINKYDEWANKRQMSFNIDKCSVMHIGHNNMQSNCNMSNQQLLTTDQQQNQESSSPKTSSGKNKQRKAVKLPTEYWGSLPAISGAEKKN